MRNLVRIMSIAALGALVVVACDQHAVEPAKSPVSDNSFAKDGAVALEVPCEDCCSSDNDSFVSSPAVSGANVGDYCSWPVKTYNFCDSGSPQIQFEGQFDSFVRGLNGWNVDLVPTASSNWCSIVANIQYEHNNPGTAPSCGSFSPSNVTGANGTLFGLSFGTGFYTYNSTTNTITSYDKSILVWKDCDAGNTTDVCTADAAYVLTVNPIVPTPGAGGTFTSAVSFEWDCITITSCEACL